MKLAFKDILNADIYENTRVMFVLGKYNIFNNLVSDELKSQCIYTQATAVTVDISDEFGLEPITNEGEQDGGTVSSVDFNTFLEVCNVPSVTGRWFCKVELSTLTKKQKEALDKYIRSPSEYGMLVIVSNEWKDYREYLRNKALAISTISSLIELSFPKRDTLKELVKQLFSNVGIEITNGAAEMFIVKMSNAYDEYDSVIKSIKDKHGEGKLDIADLKVLTKGIEHYVIDDFVRELTKPLSSGKTNNKKILRIMMILKDEMGEKELVYKLLSVIDEEIEYRLMINNGTIPIYLNYFFKDILKILGPDSKYNKVNEYTFRKKASLAAMTSIRDWEYMKLILQNAIRNTRISEEEMKERCDKALYEICVRSVISGDRINNIIGIDNVLKKNLIYLDRIKYEEKGESEENE